MQLVCFGCGKINRIGSNDIEEGIPCQQCHKSLLKPDPSSLSDEILANVILNDQMPILVDYWAPWCKPCRSMAAAFSSAAQKSTLKARFIKLNTDEFPSIANKHRVKSLPTLVLFLRRREVARMNGSQSQKQILQWLTQNLQA